MDPFSAISTSGFPFLRAFLIKGSWFGSLRRIRGRNSIGSTSVMEAIKSDSGKRIVSSLSFCPVSVLGRHDSISVCEFVFPGM